MGKEIYIKLTADEVETIKCALRSQCDDGDNLNFDGSEYENLITKICCQEDSICRPYVVSGTHYHQMLKLPRRLVIMAEEPKWAIEYAKEHVEKEGGTFEVDVNSVHEMGDDEFIFAEDLE